MYEENSFNKRKIRSDHVNQDRLDNRKSNLRICIRSENLRNRGKMKNNKSGFKGVYWMPKIQRWYAQIAVNKKNIFLGSFLNIKDAAKAYNVGAKKYHGEFAYINNIWRI